MWDVFGIACFYDFYKLGSAVKKMLREVAWFYK